MWKIGVSFESTEPLENLKRRVVDPVAVSLQHGGEGIYSNHLQQDTARREDGQAVIDHLLVFEVLDFKEGIRRVRTLMQEKMDPQAMRFHNLSDCRPIY
jgi:hypothetical protein